MNLLSLLQVFLLFPSFVKSNFLEVPFSYLTFRIQINNPRHNVFTLYNKWISTLFKSSNFLNICHLTMYWHPISTKQRKPSYRFSIQREAYKCTPSENQNDLTETLDRAQQHPVRHPFPCLVYIGSGVSSLTTPSSYRAITHPTTFARYPPLNESKTLPLYFIADGFRTGGE